MEDFGTVLAHWAGFYTVLSQVSATFAGLLFVSLSLRYALLNQEGFGAVKRLARHTFKAFLFLVIFSLILLIPEAGALGVAVPLLAVALYALGTTARIWVEDAKEEGADQVRVRGARKIYLLSLLTYVMFMVVALLLLLGETRALYLVVGLVIWNLALVTASSWDLLVELKNREKADLG
ncbi:hypothetical protein PVT67_07785 [Gallaecimonas kandeliae]|uniref:hypothetical protein n=1 Tax=Gallaecimonas kandeliae TaxID=3029055 RepID=UPI0026495B39|nr:hypothetical protein [Gallaecimonas kandeliae]WKE67125.1 hypothetical protein PVT67_07785 [Gallaecimonas kandeliae]